MKKKRFVLPKEAKNLYLPDDLVPIVIKRNGCVYRWGIPYKNYDQLNNLDKKLPFKDLKTLGGVVLDILVFDRMSIDFKNNATGVQKLDVIIRSSESDDRQLLHNLSEDLRLDSSLSNRDNIPGTKNEDD